MKRIHFLYFSLIWITVSTLHSNPQEYASWSAKIIKLFHQLQGVSKLTSDQKQLLEQAFHLFHDTPGFPTTATNLLRHVGSDSAKGYWFELKKALDLHSKHCEGNRSLSFTFSNIRTVCQTTQRREFDIELRVGKRLMLLCECKAGNWRQRPSGKIAKQFLDQKKIAGQLQHPKRDVQYLVVSQQYIPDEWKEWFKQQQISFQEDVE